MDLDVVGWLGALGVAVCWIEDMRNAAVLVEDEGIVILNRQCSPDETREAFWSLLPEVLRCSGG